jgi:hypothetical protein
MIHRGAAFAGARKAEAQEEDGCSDTAPFRGKAGTAKLRATNRAKTFPHRADSAPKLVSGKQFVVAATQSEVNGSISSNC